MADSIVGGLFGVSPEMYSQARNDRDYAQALKIGTSYAAPGTMMSPSLGPLYAQAAQTGQLLGRGVGGLLGIEDPELKKITAIKELSSQFDLTSPTGMRDFARSLQQIAPQEAMMAAKRADEMSLSSANVQKKQIEIQNETQLRQELAALGPNATEEQLMSVLQKYGSPDKVLAALQSSARSRENLEFRREMAQNRLGMQSIALGMKSEREQEKKQEKADKQEQAANAAIMGADRIINEVGEAKKKVSGFTSGLGSYLSVIPMTEAKDLSKRLTTIKANLGFDRLQQMRDASPTGGALGQVAVQELVALQSTIASLDQDQSPGQLKDALDKIELHYSNWKDAVKKAGKATVSGQPSGSNEIDFNSLPKRK